MQKSALSLMVANRPEMIPDYLLQQYLSIYRQAFPSQGGISFVRFRDELSVNVPKNRPYIVLALSPQGKTNRVFGGAFFLYSEASRSFYVFNIGVDPSVRGNGIGSFLLNQGELELTRREPGARFMTCYTLSIHKNRDRPTGEPLNQTLARSRLWEKVGYQRVRLLGSVPNETGVEYDLRVKELAVAEQPRRISTQQVAKILIDLHRNPAIHGFLDPKRSRFKLNKEGKGMVRRALGNVAGKRTLVKIKSTRWHR